MCGKPVSSLPEGIVGELDVHHQAHQALESRIGAERVEKPFPPHLAEADHLLEFVGGPGLVQQLQGALEVSIRALREVLDLENVRGEQSLVEVMA